MATEPNCKIITRNLNFDSKEEDVKKLYEKYGAVEECEIKRHKDTKKSKGFAVIKYAKASSVDDAMGDRPHELDGRTLEPHRAGPIEYSKRLESHHTCNEIFVGDWKPEVEESDLRDYFGQFGTIEEVTLPKQKDDETKYRGFAVIKFDDYDPVDQIVHKRIHNIKEHRLYVTKWISRKDMNQLQRKFGRNNNDNFRFSGGNLQQSLLNALAQNILGGGGKMRGGRRGRGRGGPYSWK